MERVKIKEITILNFYEFYTIIKETIIQCIDVQIFISNTLFKRLLQEDESRIIWKEDVYNSFHYCDKEEKAFILNVKENNENKTIQMHFVSSCSDYMHLTYFASKGILYQHYLRGMKMILIINIK